jgi:hypothetical protein
MSPRLWNLLVSTNEEAVRQGDTNDQVRQLAQKKAEGRITFGISAFRIPQISDFRASGLLPQRSSQGQFSDLRPPISDLRPLTSDIC